MARKPSVYIGTIFGIIGFVAIALFCYIFQNIANANAASSVEFHPYFSYTPEDVQSLRNLKTDKVINEDEINYWIQVAYDLVKKNRKEIDATRAYTYLFTAHRDAVALTNRATNTLAGSLDAVSRRTLCLLLPDQCSSIPPSDNADYYSLKLADLVIQRITERLTLEKKAMVNAVVPKPPKEWGSNTYYFGSTFGQETPWMLTIGNQFRPSNPKAYEPNEIIVQKQELQQILASLTKEQIDIARKWAGGGGTILTSGQWLEIANTYMKEHNIPLEKAIFIRSILAMGITDATIAYFDAKYTYWKPRPKMIFPDLNVHLKAATSPSYPSGHATISMAAAIIMDYYFPENKTVWDSTAKQVADSRLYGGVHFPIDDHDGIELGRKIGNWIVSKLEKNQN